MKPTINVIFQKNKNNEIGTVFVNYKLPKTPQKRISTKIKITQKDFKKYYVKATHNFADKFKHPELKEKIEELKSLNPFEGINTSTNDDFIIFFENKIFEEKKGGGTKLAYHSVLKKLKKYYPVLPFAAINDNMLDDYKGILQREVIFNRNGKAQTLSEGVIKYHFTVIAKYIKLANKKKSAKINFDLSELDLRKNTKRPDLLSNEDLDKLKAYPKDGIYIYEVTFGLLQYFGNGLRFSDLFFLKIENLKDNFIELHAPKTKDYMKRSYSVMFIRTLYGYLFRNKTSTSTNLNIDLILDIANDKTNMNAMKAEIINELKRLAVENKHNYIFKVPLELQNYNPLNDFTIEEFNALNRERTRFGQRLKSVAKEYNFDCKKVTAHSFRYKFVDTCLNKKIPYYNISKALNHKSIAVTELYIKRNFTVEDNSEISNVIDSIHLGQKT